MNGASSNTDGSQVANIGWWPKNVVIAVLGVINNVAGTIKALVEGTQFPAQVDFSQRGGSDVISDKLMAELARRLIVTFEAKDQGNIVQSPTAPDDKTKLWIQTDPVTSIPNGGIKKWDADTSSWVDTSAAFTPYVPPLRRTLRQRIAAGASVVNFNFADILTANYFVLLTWTTQNEDNSWAVPPATFPSAFGYIVSNKTNTTLTVTFYGVPTGGLMADGFVEAIPAP